LIIISIIADVVYNSPTHPQITPTSMLTARCNKLDILYSV